MKSARVHELDDAMAALFRRWPALCGFSVQEMRTLPGKHEVVLADIAVQPWAGDMPSHELLSEIVGTLIDLVDERPEAGKLLAGRTFAPAIH